MRRKVLENKFEPGLLDTVHDLYFITTILVSQVRITNAKVPDATMITDLDKGVFEDRCQDVPSHRNFTFKERHLAVNPSYLREIW